jgi:hypothetical protein
LREAQASGDGDRVGVMALASAKAYRVAAGSTEIQSL